MSSLMSYIKGILFLSSVCNMCMFKNPIKAELYCRFKPMKISLTKPANSSREINEKTLQSFDRYSRRNMAEILAIRRKTSYYPINR